MFLPLINFLSKSTSKFNPPTRLEHMPSASISSSPSLVPMLLLESRLVEATRLCEWSRYPSETSHSDDKEQIRNIGSIASLTGIAQSSAYVRLEYLSLCISTHLLVFIYSVYLQARRSRSLSFSRSRIWPKANQGQHCLSRICRHTLIGG